MSRLAAQTIRALGLVSPFSERRVTNGKTHGLSCCGYDVRIREGLWLWPLWGRLASTIEHFDLPPDIAIDIKDKSSWARKFVHVQNTTGEPGWRGYLTVELTRHLPWPIYIPAGSPIAQVTFERLEQPTEQPYAGKYQDQPPRPVSAIREGEGQP